MIPYRLLYPGVPLYRAQENACALLALPNPTEAPETVTLEEAVRSETLGASFLYCDRPPSLSSEEDARALFQWIYDALANFERCERAVFWRGAAATYALGLDGSAGRTGSALELPLAREWRFRVARSARLAPTGNMLAFTDTAAAFSLVPAFTAVFSGGALLLAEGGVLSCTATELARRLDVSRASLYRAFDALERTGAIRRTGKRIEVLSTAELEAAIETEPS